MNHFSGFLLVEGLLGLPVWLTCVFVAVFGAIIGSFLNVVIHRLPREESIVFPNSRCPSCQAQIRAYDNLPIISYLILRGRCRACRAPISPRYTAVEALTALLWAAVFGRRLLARRPLPRHHLRPGFRDGARRAHLHRRGAHAPAER